MSKRDEEVTEHLVERHEVDVIKLKGGKAKLKTVNAFGRWEFVLDDNGKPVVYDSVSEASKDAVKLESWRAYT